MKGNKTTLFIIWLTFNIWYFIITLIGIVIAFLYLKPFNKPLADLIFQALIAYLIAIILIAIINFTLLYLQLYYLQTVANFYRSLAGDKYLKRK